MRIVSTMVSALFLMFPTVHFAVAQVSENTALIGQIDYDIFTNDVWGYTDALGNEYALVGLQNGLSIVKVEADTIMEVDFIAGAGSIWRDIKTHAQYAYVTNENQLSNGLDIIDLSGLPQSARLAGSYNSSFVSAHNLYIADGFAYIAGSNGAQGVEILDLSDPENPVRTGGWAADYFHDVFVLRDTLYASAGNRGSVMVLDVTNKSLPRLIAEIPMPDGGFVHNAWTTADGNYVMTTQENPGLSVKMWDIHDLQNPVLLDEYLSRPSLLAHNAHIAGDFAFISHYGDGLRIVDLREPDLLVEVGFYDTHQNDQGSFEGNWGAFPFTESGYIYATDEANGLFVVSFNGRRAGRVRGRIADAQTQAPLMGANVSVLETLASDFADGAGNYGLGFAEPGTFTLRVTAADHQLRDVPVTVAEGQTLSLDIELQSLVTGISGGRSTDLDGFSLEQNFPNPFNAGTSIRYQIPAQAHVLAKIFSVTGREVRTLVDERQPAGTYRLNWDGTDRTGKAVASGIYLLRLRAGGKTQMVKMAFIR